MKSNRITETDFYISKEARRYTRVLFDGRQTAHRQKWGARLLRELDLLAEIPHCELFITDQHQKHRRSGGRIVYREYGHYKTLEKAIYITNRTAARRQLLAEKTFYDTLIHEWMHHYDTQKLNLRSIHCKGFYARIAFLKDRLENIA